MSILQILSATLTAVFTFPLIILCLRPKPYWLSVSALGTLTVLSIIVTTVDLSHLLELRVNMHKGEIHIKTASPEVVTETLEAVAEQEQAKSEDSAKTVAALVPLVEQAREKQSSERTDTDYLALATDEWRAKKFDDAMRYAYAGLGYPASDIRVTAALHSRLGAIQQNLKLTGLAEASFREAIRLAPEFSAPRNNLGIILMNTGREEEAEKSFKESIRLNPDDAYAYINLGNLLKDMKRFEEAEKSFLEAIRINPDNSYAYNNLGIVLMNTDRNGEAEKFYMEAIRLNPDNFHAYTNLGNLMMNTGREGEAGKYYLEAVRIKPDYRQALNNLEYLLKKNNN